jgi:hypothetical protein
MRSYAALALSALLAAWLGGWAEAHPGAIADGRDMRYVRPGVKRIL